jgi:hypothetical protein
MCWVRRGQPRGMSRYRPPGRLDAAVTAPREDSRRTIGRQERDFWFPHGRRHPIELNRDDGSRGQAAPIGAQGTMSGGWDERRELHGHAR